MYLPFRASWQTVIRPSTSFPPPPLKFRTAGFPSVRLQTRFTPRPPSPAVARRLIGRHCRYLRPRRLSRNGSCDQSAPAISDHDRESSGPWLLNRLCCPVESSLTMATSAPLGLPGGLWIIPPGCGSFPPTPEGPQFTLPVLSPRAVARTPVAPASAYHDVFLASWGLRQIRTGSATTCPCVSEPARSCHEVAAFASCYGPVVLLALLRQGFYNRAFMGRVTPCPMSIMTKRLIVIYRCRTCTGWTGSLMGCERIDTNRTGIQTSTCRSPQTRSNSRQPAAKPRVNFTI